MKSIIRESPQDFKKRLIREFYKKSKQNRPSQIDQYCYRLLKKEKQCENQQA